MMRRTTAAFLFCLYALAGVFTIVLGNGIARYFAPQPFARDAMPWDAILSFAGVMIFFLLFARHIRAPWFWDLGFRAALFFGALFVGLASLGSWGFAFAVGALLLPVFWPSAVAHDAFVVVGCVGIALGFSLSFSSGGLLFFLFGMALYDAIAASPRGPLVALARRLMGQRIIPGLFVPGSWRDWFEPLESVSVSSSAVLGTGDLILPLMLVGRVALFHAFGAVAVLVGTLSGLAVLLAGETHRPRAGLPWLALGTSVPYAAWYLFGGFA